MNIFDISEGLQEKEILEPLIPDRGVLIERIISFGNGTPPGLWLDQKRDEWVILLQGEASLSWEDGRECRLTPGDWLFIPAGEKHRVEHTSGNPPAVWLAVHGRLS